MVYSWGKPSSNWMHMALISKNYEGEKNGAGKNCEG
jgi:hypothetical protein